jgi:hypothetical protein
MFYQVNGFSSVLYVSFVRSHVRFDVRLDGYLTLYITCDFLELKRTIGVFMSGKCAGI